MKAELPEGYFCPKCLEKPTHDLVANLRRVGMPTLDIVVVALRILVEAECPEKLTKPIFEWAEKYSVTPNSLNEEEQEKLKLIKWKKAATGKP